MQSPIARIRSLTSQFRLLSPAGRPRFAISNPTFGSCDDKPV
jgi:hypothetical protein